MTAREKARPLMAQPHREMRDVEVKQGHENELAAASERFATTLRAAAVETMKGGPRESTSAASTCCGRPRSSRIGIDASAKPSIHQPNAWSHLCTHRAPSRGIRQRFRPNGDLLLTTGLSAATRLASLGMPKAAMMLRADPKYPTRRTYVLKLQSDATPDVLLGRLENLVTCRQSDFTSARELLEFIARDIVSCGAEPLDNS